MSSESSSREEQKTDFESDFVSDSDSVEEFYPGEPNKFEEALDTYLTYKEYKMNKNMQSSNFTDHVFTSTSDMISSNRRNVSASPTRVSIANTNISPEVPIIPNIELSKLSIYNNSSVSNSNFLSCQGFDVSNRHTLFVPTSDEGFYSASVEQNQPLKRVLIFNVFNLMYKYFFRRINHTKYSLNYHLIIHQWRILIILMTMIRMIVIETLCILLHQMKSPAAHQRSKIDQESACKTLIFYVVS